MKVTWSAPPGYDNGIYRLRVVLTDEEATLVRLTARIPFLLPQLPERSVHSDYSHAALVFDATGPKIGGVLLADGWSGHCSTNGVEEALNKTTIETVCEELRRTVSATLDTVRTWSELGHYSQD